MALKDHDNCDGVGLADLVRVHGDLRCGPLPDLVHPAVANRRAQHDVAAGGAAGVEQCELPLGLMFAGAVR